MTKKRTIGKYAYNSLSSNTHMLSQYQGCNRVVHIWLYQIVFINTSVYNRVLGFGIRKRTKVLYIFGEPNVTVCYKQKWTFFNPKFEQICPLFDPFRTPKSLKLFGIPQLILVENSITRIILLVITYFFHCIVIYLVASLTN